MTKVERYFQMAAEIAANGDPRRQHWLGAVGIRSDGAIVKSCNLPCRGPQPTAHAENRVVRKLDTGAVVYVVRVLRNGKLAMARPCKRCRLAMQSRNVRRCYYSVNNFEYGVIKF